ncbi:MAG: DUF1579 domain-containing protein [Planctomycetales bacterium]|nr:DUF1579 domain-containing protein [Planctomycetales bacterium]
MNRTTLVLGAVAAALGVAATLGAERALSQEGMPDDKMMKEWLEMNAPAAQHKKLEALVGEWETVTSVMGTPGSKGSAKFEMEMGGRWLKQTYSGSMMGTPFTGVGYLGFDRIRGRYVQIWLDTLSTAPSIAYGDFGQDGKVLQMFGEMDEPQMKIYGKTARYVLRLKSADQVIFEVHDTHIGETGTKVFDMTYTRKKK